MFKKTFVKYLCVFISLPLNGMEINNLIINTKAEKGYKTTKIFQSTLTTTKLSQKRLETVVAINHISNLIKNEEAEILNYTSLIFNSNLYLKIYQEAMYDSLALEFLEDKTLNEQKDILEEITKYFLSPNDSLFLQDPARQTYKNSILNEIENFYNSYCIEDQEGYEHFLAIYHAYIFPYIDKFANEVINGKFLSKYTLHPFLIHNKNYKRFYKENISIYASDINKAKISLSRHKGLLNDNQKELQPPEDQIPVHPHKKLQSRSNKISPLSDIDNFRISDWYDEDNPLNHIFSLVSQALQENSKYYIFLNGENILSTFGISLAEINGKRTLFITKYCNAYFAIKKKIPIKFGFYENNAFCFRMFELHAWLLTYLIKNLTSDKNTISLIVRCKDFVKTGDLNVIF